MKKTIFLVLAFFLFTTSSVYASKGKGLLSVFKEVGEVIIDPTPYLKHNQRSLRDYLINKPGSYKDKGAYLKLSDVINAENFYHKAHDISSQLGGHAANLFAEYIMVFEPRIKFSNSIQAYNHLYVLFDRGVKKSIENKLSSVELNNLLKELNESDLFYSRLGRITGRITKPDPEKVTKWAFSVCDNKNYPSDYAKGKREIISYLKQGFRSDYSGDYLLTTPSNNIESYIRKTLENSQESITKAVLGSYFESASEAINFAIDRISIKKYPDSFNFTDILSIDSPPYYKEGLQKGNNETIEILLVNKCGYEIKILFRADEKVVKAHPIYNADSNPKCIVI